MNLYDFYHVKIYIKKHLSENKCQKYFDQSQTWGLMPWAVIT